MKHTKFFFKLFFILSCIFMLNANKTFAQTPLESDNTSNNQSNFLSFDGNIYDASTLSQDTIHWINWYNSLPNESQEMINYIPNELLSDEHTLTFETSTSNLTLEAEQHYISTLALAPTNGYEPVYNPSYWNNSSRNKKGKLLLLCNGYNFY